MGQFRDSCSFVRADGLIIAIQFGNLFTTHVSQQYSSYSTHPDKIESRPDKPLLNIKDGMHAVGVT